MKRIIVALMLTFVLLFSMAFIGSIVKAETVNFTVTSYITKAEAIPVPDVEGHVLILGERRGVAVFEDGSPAAYHTRFKCDFVKYHGPCEGYTDLTYPDGSKTIVKYKLTVEIPAGKKLPAVKGKGDFIKGTGRFEGIKGTVSFKGYYITPYGKETKGDMVLNVTGSYTLPSK